MRTGIRALRRKSPHLRGVHELAGDPEVRRHVAGFEGLARIVVGQQLSLASAQAIWKRTSLAVTPMTADAFVALSDDELRTAGLSRGKVRTLRALSEAIRAGLDLDLLADSADEEVHAALTALPGIGPWTADIYLLFCLGRADAFAPGDLALQIAARAALGLNQRPSREELFEIAEAWRPWRGVAAHLLWAYYKVADRALLMPKNA
ncbi:MAG: DNA-3-methyladenine glycosylase 2 family protein [Hyphomicrobium sp.]|jgi:DNA-3-methyladenine glycosylase II